MIDFLLVVRRKSTVFIPINDFCCSFSSRLNYGYLIGHRRTNIVFTTFEESTLELVQRLLIHLVEKERNTEILKGRLYYK